MPQIQSFSRLLHRYRGRIIDATALVLLFVYLSWCFGR